MVTLEGEDKKTAAQQKSAARPKTTPLKNSLRNFLRGFGWTNCILNLKKPTQFLACVTFLDSPWMKKQVHPATSKSVHLEIIILMNSISNDFTRTI